MGKKKWFVVLFYIVFILVYALVLTVPIGMVVQADDLAPADPVTDESSGDNPPPEEAPPEEPPPAEAPVSEASPAEIPVTEAPAEPVYMPPPAVVEQPPVEAEAEQPAVGDPPQPADGQPAVDGVDQPAPLTQPDADEGSGSEPQDEASTAVTGESASPGAADPGQPAVSPDVQAAPLEMVAGEELDKPVEMLDALPEGANLVVLDETGTALPLAAGETAETLENGDPMYCSGTDSPGSASCLSYATIEQAINHAKVAGNGNCTIYVAFDYSSPTHTTISINGSEFDTNSNINLFGGYDLIDNSVVGQTALAQNFLISNITGSLTLANFYIQEFISGGNTIEVNNSEDVTLNNMNINNSGNGNAVRVNHSEDVTIQNSRILDRANGYGVYVHQSKGIKLLDTTIREYGNDGGIYMEYTANVDLQRLGIQSHDAGCTGMGCSTDAIRAVNGANYTLWGVNAISDYGSGFTAGSGVTGYVRIFDSEFDDNGQRGISVFSGGPVSITNTSARDNVGDYGLVVQSDTIDMKNSHVDSNQTKGAFLFATDWITIQTSTFSGNHHNYGLYATSANSYIDVNGVTANGNSYYGARLMADTYINVFNSNFSANGFYGLMTYAPDSVALYNVTSSGNSDDGVVLNSPGTITVTCSVFKNNGQDGLESSMSGSHASLTLNSVTITGNGLATDITGGTVYENLNYPCGGGSDTDTDTDTTETTETVTPAVGIGIVYVITPEGVELIPVTGGQFVDLSCTGTSMLKLPTGEETIINQAMCGYRAAMEQVMPADLPAPIPEPWAYVDGFNVTLMYGENVVIEAFEGATYTARFPITTDEVNEPFHVLFWDAEANDGLGGWVDLGGARDELMWSKTHDRTGTFLLVK